MKRTMRRLAGFVGAVALAGGISIASAGTAGATSAGEWGGDTVATWIYQWGGHANSTCWPCSADGNGGYTWA